jgi:hypothetical protein
VADPSSDGQAARRLLSAAALPCGADVDPLLEQVADRHAELDAHQRECVHCQACAVPELAHRL